MIGNDILAAMGKVGKLFYDTMIDKLNTGNYPKASTDGRGFTSIQGATSVRSPEQNGNTFKEEIVIDLDLAPFAGAYEYGSGLRGKKKQRYPINPKNKTIMSFPESDWPGYDDSWDWGAFPVNGTFYLPHVLHPGVNAKPYIRPTITQINDEVKKLLAREFKVAVLREGKPVEVI
jgi:hypothetical protein